MVRTWWRKILTVSMILAAPGIVPSAAPAAARQGIRIDTAFDNSYVSVQGPGERYLEIDVIAPEGDPFRDDGDRPRLNIALVIDKSGSMAASNKIGFVKEAALSILDRLSYGDRFSVIAYDDRVSVLVPSEAVEDRYRAQRLIEGLYPGGSTNLSGGLIEGYRQVRRHYIPDGINRVLLLSDGLANRGITSPEELSRIAIREGGRGTSLTTFGVGLDFNEDLLASLSECGRGTYYYIDRAHRIPEMLAREFSFLQQVVALNVTVTIEVVPEVIVSDIMGYQHRRSGNRYFIQIGDLAAGEHRRIMARLTAPPRGAGEHRLGKVLLSYQGAGDRRETTSSKALRLRYVRDRHKVSKNLNRPVSERATVFRANAARQEAARMVDSGDLDGADQLLGESLRALKEAPVQNGKIKDELVESEAYRSAIEAPMDARERSALQKGVKYKAYKVLQSK